MQPPKTPHVWSGVAVYTQVVYSFSLRKPSGPPDLIAELIASAKDIGLTYGSFGATRIVGSQPA